MQVVPGTLETDPPIWAAYRESLERVCPGTKIEYIDRFEFYERSARAFATVATTERALYACIILKKGTVL
jgi:L-fucose mutarotase